MIILTCTCASFAGTISDFYKFKLTGIENNGLDGCKGDPSIKLNISICGLYNDNKKHDWNGAKCYSIGDTSRVKAPKNAGFINTNLNIKLSKNKLEKYKEKLLNEERNDIFVVASLNKAQSVCGFFTNKDANLKLSSRRSIEIELGELEEIIAGQVKQYKINFHGNYNYGADPAKDEMEPFSVLGDLEVSLSH